MISTSETSCSQLLSPIRQPPSSYKACVYGWQRQASSFKSSNRRDFCSLASQEPGFESNRAYLGHVRPSYTGSGTSCAKHSSVGSSIASGMAAAITTGHPTSNWRDEMQGWGRHPSISVISWQSVLLVAETGIPGENHRPATSHWQTLSHIAVSPEWDSYSQR